MKKTYSLIILSFASILVSSGYKIGAYSMPVPLKLPPQGIESQTNKISQNNSRDTSTLEKALLGRWVSEPLVPGKTLKLTYYFSLPSIWLTGQEVDGKQLPGGELRYKVIKVNEKENTLQIQYGLNLASESTEAIVVFSPDRQNLKILFRANGIYVPNLQPFTYAGSQPQP